MISEELGTTAETLQAIRRLEHLTSLMARLLLAALFCSRDPDFVVQNDIKKTLTTSGSVWQ